MEAAAVQTAEVQAAEVHFGAWLKRAWAIYRRNFGAIFTLNLFVLALMLVPMAAAFFSAWQDVQAQNPAAALLTLLSMLLGVIVLGPFIAAGPVLLQLRAVDAEEKVSIATAFKLLREGFGFYFPMLRYLLFIGFVLGGIGGIIGFVAGFAAAYYEMPYLAHVANLIYIPALFFIFTQYIIVDRKLTVLDSLGASFQLVKHRFWRLLLFYFVVMVIGYSGLLALGVGVLITFPYSYVLLTVAYRNYTAPAPAVESGASAEPIA